MTALDSLVDLRPLRENRTFRRLWLGTTASGLGAGHAARPGGGRPDQRAVGYGLVLRHRLGDLRLRADRHRGPAPGRAGRGRTPGRDTWAVVSRGTVVQSSTPAAYRGRVASLEHIVAAAGPQLGTLRAGLVAAVTSGGASLAIGGALGVLGTSLVALTIPALRRFTIDDRVTDEAA